MANAKDAILVLGGMGSRASTYFLKKAYDHLIGYDDHNLPRVILDNSSDIPSRGRYFAGNGADPTPELLDRLTHYAQNFNISAIYIPCNTVHLLFDRVPEFHRLWVHLPNTIIGMLKKKKYEKILVVGSTASLHNNLYQSDSAIKFDHANEFINKTFLNEIYIRKKGLEFESREHLRSISTVSTDYDAILLACTELEPFKFQIPVISSTELYSKHLAQHMLQLRQA
jgi:aspartate/glutamate racemase